MKKENPRSQVFLSFENGYIIFPDQASLAELPSFTGARLLSGFHGVLGAGAWGGGGGLWGVERGERGGGLMGVWG